MERYLVFAGDTYYPTGGWDDFVSDHADLERAKEAMEDSIGGDGIPGRWAHVVDTETGHVIAHERVTP